MLNLVLQRGKLLRDSLAFFGLLAILFSRHCLVHIIDSASLRENQLVIGDCMATLQNLTHTRIIGHLSLAEVYANEFLSDVTDGAVVKHAWISVIVLQTGLKRHTSIAELQKTPHIATRGRVYSRVLVSNSIVVGT